MDVHLHGERIGALSRAGDGYELTYLPGVVERHGAGAVLLSNSLPVRPEPYSAATSRAYVEGLLPEGEARQRVAGQLGIDPADGFSLIAALGHDCPGAVAFAPPGEEPRPPAPGASAEPSRPAGSPPPIALAGDRPKHGMTRDGLEGDWRFPDPGALSTHVVKPELDELPEIATNEMFCMGVFRQAGLPAARTSIETIDGRRCLVSPRFDQVWDGEAPRRLHQETFCQALGIAPGAESGSEEAEAPGFAEATGLMRAVGLQTELPILLQAALANYVLGNGDAHGRNVALLFRDGKQELMFFDVTSTLAYGDREETGMILPDDYDVTTYLRAMRRVAAEFGTEPHIFHIQASCGLKYVCDAVEVVAERCEEEEWHQPIVERIFKIAQDRAGRCAERLLLWDHLDQ